MFVREAVEAGIRELAIHSVTVLGRCSALWSNTSPGLVLPEALVRLVRNLPDGARRHKLAVVFPRLPWQTSAGVSLAPFICAPIDAAIAVLGKASAAQEPVIDALPKQAISTSSNFPRNVDERTASEALSISQCQPSVH